MKQESAPVHLDIKVFAQTANAMSGHDRLSNYERLMLETQGLGAGNLLNWKAHGDLRIDQTGVEQVWLHLTVEASLLLICQRCMGLADIAVAVDRWFRFVHSEEVAQAQDEHAEEDVLALGTDFNLTGLIEDEVLLAMPLVPRHTVCPVEPKLSVADPAFEAASTEKHNPFSVLTKLREGHSG
jgi:uncharacterized protein